MGGKGELGGDEGRETRMRTYCMEKIHLIENRQQKKQRIGKPHDASPGPTWLS